MELIIGVGSLVLLVLWGAWGHWRYYRAVQAAALERRYLGSQIETLWRRVRAEASRPQPRAAANGMEVWERALEEIEGWGA